MNTDFIKYYPKVLSKKTKKEVIELFIKLVKENLYYKKLLMKNRIKW